jgi:HrpA-like RNA helicase
MDNILSNINDILDVEGKNNNFLTDKPFSPEYVKLASKWSQLPMYADKSSVKKFFDLLHNCQVILLISGTGSGKTVLVPKFFLKYIKTMGLGGKIAITNPKILTTIYNAEYGAKTLDVKLGEEVGYKYKGSDRTHAGSNSKLLYVTDGLILATILSGDTVLSEYQGIIIDEAHERHVQIDMLLKLIKEILPLRPEFKLIIMSATINSAVFRNYFNVEKIKFGEMEVSGESNFPIQQNWLDPKVKINRSNYLELGIQRCLDILDTTETGDIIIFVPTQNDAIKGCMLLKESCPNTLKLKKSYCEKVFCIEVFSKMKQSNKDLAVSKDLYKSKGFDRKVIFATNVAESSITFDGLVYVIETGFELANYYEVSDNSYVVSKQYTSQAQIKQRIGRAGRTQPGISYHLYTQTSYNTFKIYPEPNISVIDLTDFVLSLTKYAKTIHNLVPIIKGLITIPKIEQIAYSIYKLHFIKCLKLIEPTNQTNLAINTNTDSDSAINTNTDSDSAINSDTDSVSVDLISSSESYKSSNKQLNNKQLNNKQLNIESIKWSKIRNYEQLKETFNGALTGIGINILRFKSSPVLTALAVLMSKYMNCLIEMTQLSAILEISDGKLESLFEINRKDTDKAIKYFSKVAVEGSDHLTVLNIYKQHYLEKNYKYLNRKSFENIEKRTQQLLVYANSIEAKSYEHMQTKYKLIQAKPYEDPILNIQYIIAYSNYYNMLFKEANNIYTSINYVENSTAPLEYFILTPPIKTHTDFVVCYSLGNVFGRKSFKCLSQIPKSIIKDIFSTEDVYFDHLKKYKQFLK